LPSVSGLACVFAGQQKTFVFGAVSYIWPAKTMTASRDGRPKQKTTVGAES